MTLKDWHQLGTKTLSPQEAKWVIAAAIDRDPSFITLNPTYVPSPAEEDRIQEWLARRTAGEPLSRLKGQREFWSLPFHLNAHTLDPRPDTEVLIEGVLKWVGTRKLEPMTILDLGTGSGCILISLLHELPHSKGVGVDISEEALTMARQNAVLNKVDQRATFRQGNWAENIEGPFDIIVSNPPYIPLTQPLPHDVLTYDPHRALFGGDDGLQCYRILVQQVGPLLSPQGLAAFEIGAGQRNEVEAIFVQAGFKVLFVLTDLAGIERVIGVVAYHNK